MLKLMDKKYSQFLNSKLFNRSAVLLPGVPLLEGMIQNSFQHGWLLWTIGHYQIEDAITVMGYKMAPAASFSGGF